MDKWYTYNMEKEYYHSFNHEMRRRFGRKVYKLSLDGGMTCPNRDGRSGTGGCIFCSAGGSGDFAASNRKGINAQLEEATRRIQNKLGSGDHGFVAYFQSYTNTYASVGYLEELFMQVVERPEILALSIGTRPDCLPEDVLNLLFRLNKIKPVWVELGLQTIHEETARYINRGYPLSVFEDSLFKLQNLGIETIVHVILGLPGESREMMLETVSYLAKIGISGIKLQLLHVLENTALADIYRKEPFHVMEMEEYLDLILECISILPPEIVIHRLTGDGAKRDLIAPLWSGNKKKVLNTFQRMLREREISQGCKLI